MGRSVSAKSWTLSLRGAQRRSNLDHSQLRDCRALTLFGLAMTFTFCILIFEFYQYTL